MRNNTIEDIKEYVTNEDIKFIRLQFTDIFGTLKNVAITSSQIDKALDNNCMFDGSSIEGFVRIEESDMYLRPDIQSYTVFPWLPQHGKVARLICDVYKPNGEPFDGDPRYVLKKVLKEAKDMGYDFNVGPELEFFLFHTDSEGRPTTKTHDYGGYFDMGPIDLGESARRDMCLTLEEMGFEIETSHHEVANGQHEIDFKYGDALPTADNIMTFKYVVKSIAQKHGLYASFMPKPIYGIAGSGMHTNMSLMKDGKNAFYDPDDKNGLSEVAYQFIAGVLAHVTGMAAITNPLVNSYKRLVPGYEAPCYVAWSCRNRSPLLRIPASRGMGTRVELRSPDPSCNPYLVLALALAAGLDGIKNKMIPPNSVDRNIYDMTEQERAEANIKSLPGDLDEAIEAMQNDELIRNTLGDHIYNKYIEAKTDEWNDYHKRVTKWEIDNYLSKY